ncbi:hypothetical protein MJG53_004542 [Ovis ammon polii x Ovis aries]|uniref:Uncharacterized protein n=1 Tax=Ovis ammon polii x Ovis aries TaxID=2918886 RepID=A0ACB9VBC1_9CETA|nr:hypothetical protein MJG53_004542 [Ovis ammon polii x Ovis aries]
MFLLRKEIFQGARKNSKPSCPAENATKSQIIYCDSLQSSWCFFAMEKVMQFEFVFLILMQLFSHQIFIMDKLNFFIGSHREIGVLRVLLLAGDRLGRKLRQLELLMHWPNTGGNLYNKP